MCYSSQYLMKNSLIVKRRKEEGSRGSTGGTLEPGSSPLRLTLATTSYCIPVVTHPSPGTIPTSWGAMASKQCWWLQRSACSWRAFWSQRHSRNAGAAGELSVQTGRSAKEFEPRGPSLVVPWVMGSCFWITEPNLQNTDIENADLLVCNGKMQPSVSD